jgi:hypothetical protein
MSIQHALGHLRKREERQSAAHMAARIAILQAARKNRVECCAGNNAKLPGEGHSPRQPPIGDACAHSTLDQYRMLSHSAIVAGNLG